MPITIEKEADIQPGDFYEDCSFHPCLCLRVEDDEVSGISLVDGSYPRSCSIVGCGIRKLTYEEALQWKFYGPKDTELESKNRWWPLNDELAKLYVPKK